MRRRRGAPVRRRAEPAALLLGCEPRRRLPALVAALLAALALAGTAPSGVHAELALKPCTRDPVDPSRCGRVTVPLDRAGALPGTVRLRVRVLPPAQPSLARAASPATVIALAGGPGQAAAPLLERFADAFGAAAPTRRFVAFDQRGTGGSGRLRCDALAGPVEPARLFVAVGGCATELGPARTAYPTAASVADLEAVRAALGVERVVLYGTSYGTKVALDYSAAYPQHVERLVLDSVVLPAGVDPFQRATLASVSRVLRAICEAACRFTDDPVADVATLTRRLAAAPLRGTAIDARARPHAGAIGRRALLGLLLEGDVAPSLRAAYPAAVAAGLRGDAAPLLRLVALSRGGPSPPTPDSTATFVATTCADGGVPWPPGTPIEARAAATGSAAAAIPAAAFAPFDLATLRSLGFVDLCRRWPESPIVQPRLPLPPVPALILSGDDDLRTPRADAVALAAQLPGARLLRVPHTGHNVLASEPTSCAHDAVSAFVDDPASPPAPPAPCNPRRGAIPADPLAPLRLREVAPTPGVGGRQGRTIAAIDRTLADAVDQLVARVLEGLGDGRGFGGLRAGRAAIAPGAGLLLHGYSYVPGVTLTGLIPTTGSRFALVVGGRAAARGRVIVSRSGIAGTLGGRRVHASPRQLGWRTATPARALRER